MALPWSLTVSMPCFHFLAAFGFWIWVHLAVLRASASSVLRNDAGGAEMELRFATCEAGPPPVLSLATLWLLPVVQL